MDEEIFRFIVKAVLFVADHGWKFLPLYMCDPNTAEWVHKQQFHNFPHQTLLTDFRYVINQKKKPCEHFDSSSHVLDDYLTKAQEMLESIPANIQQEESDTISLHLNEENRHLKSFLLPSEAAAILQGKKLSISPSGMHRFRQY